MNIVTSIENGVIAGVKSLYGADIAVKDITMNNTRKDFEGDYTVVTFPFTRLAKKKPDVIAQELGDYFVAEVAEVKAYNVVKGFLNLVVVDSYWKSFLGEMLGNESFGSAPANGDKVLVEFSSPNTNKPLHLGHIRNILLGWSTSKILANAGYDVGKIQIINDRGIAVCKSMLAWKQVGKGETPATTGIKGDHFVGKFYVEFEKLFQAEYKIWQASEEGAKVFGAKAKEGQDEAAFFKAYKNTYFNEYSQIGAEAKAMLLKWEAGEEETIALWKQMNAWVYEGFELTYESLGVSFDDLYYESNTYLLGKDMVQDGLDKGVFYKNEDGSVWVDLEAEKLDKKILLRSDGTAVYMTQDLGTARVRYEDHAFAKMVYTVADEQNYHFKVLFAILKKMGETYADGLNHLSYGMVNLPEGKMKSREGTVVDADDLMLEVIGEARTNASEMGSISNLEEAEQEEIYRKIGMAALKFFILKVNPNKSMIFDPKESVDLQGQTGPYIQYSIVRANRVLQKGAQDGVDMSLASSYNELQQQEKDLLMMIHGFPAIALEAAEQYDPSAIANFCYDLAKAFHKFYHDLPVLKVDTEAAAKAFRLQLCEGVSKTLTKSLDLLGIEVPKQM